MNERDFLIIKYLREFKNVTRTARALFISQPALTMRIKEIEKELNTSLIQSSNKGVLLTQTGLEVANFADEMIDEFDNLKKRIAVIDEKNMGLLRIAAPNIICEYYLPGIIREFKKEYPDIYIEVTVAPSSQVIALAKDNKIDFGFLRNDFGWDAKERNLLTTDYIAAASTTAFDMKDLPEMSRVSYTTDWYYLKLLDLWWDENYKRPPKIDVLVSSLEVCKKMVFAGNGFGFLPTIVLAENEDIYWYLLKGKDNKPIKRHSWLIYKNENISHKLLKRFKEFIIDSKFNDFLSP